METIEKTKYVCRFCDKHFSSSQRLKSHLLRLKPCHESFMKVPNEVTGTNNNIIVYDSSDNMVDDLGIVDNALIEEANALMTFKLPKLQKFSCDDKKCPYCSTIFKNKYSVNAHIQVCKEHNSYILSIETAISNYINKSNNIIRMYKEKVNTLETHNKILLKQCFKDSNRKTEIIAEQTRVQEKAIDALTYLQQNHKNTPKFELPSNFQLSDSEIEKYIEMGFPAAMLQIFVTLFKANKTIDEIPIWCLDPSREKFAIKNEDWETEIGGKQIIQAIEPVNDMFMKYVIGQYNKYILNNRVSDYNELQLRILKAYDKRVKQDFVKITCNEFNVNKLFQKE